MISVISMWGCDSRLQSNFAVNFVWIFAGAAQRTWHGKTFPTSYDGNLPLHKRSTLKEWGNYRHETNLPPPKSTRGRLNCISKRTHCDSACGVRLKQERGSAVRPSAPHWHTTTSGLNVSLTACITLHTHVQLINNANVRFPCKKLTFRDFTKFVITSLKFSSVHLVIKFRSWKIIYWYNHPIQQIGISLTRK